MMGKELENLFSEENIRKDLDTMTRQELVEELVKWRKTSPNIIKISNEILEFRTVAGSAEELKQKLTQMISTWKGTIALKDKQIEDLSAMIIALQEDPLGVESRLSNNSTKTTRTH